MVRTNHSRGPTYAYLLTSFEGPALTASGAWRSLEELQSAPGVCWRAAAVPVQQWLQGPGVAMAREQVIEHAFPTLALQGIGIASGGRHEPSIGSGHQLTVQGLRSAETAVNIPIESAWDMWEDRERIPNWMPWIKSVKVSLQALYLPSHVRQTCRTQVSPGNLVAQVQPDNPALSKWLLETEQFGRSWEFSWLAQNLAPIKYQKVRFCQQTCAMPSLRCVVARYE